MQEELLPLHVSSDYIPSFVLYVAAVSDMYSKYKLEPNVPITYKKDYTYGLATIAGLDIMLNHNIGRAFVSMALSLTYHFFMDKISKQDARNWWRQPQP